jgi:hypothetical protein
VKSIDILSIAGRKVKRRGIPEQWVEEMIHRHIQTVDGYGGPEVARRKYKIKAKEYFLGDVYEE